MPLSAIAQESENGNEGGYDQAYSDNIAEIEANKAAFAQELAARWESEALARGNDETWLGRISGALSEEDAETLLSKSEAESYDEFIGTQTTSELVFYPLKPCRVVDTRFATRWGSYGTPVGSGGTIAVRTYPSLAGQGGASDCGVYSGSAAVVVNVTAVPVSGGQGFLTVWPYGQSRPNASLVNYNSASTSGAIANAVSQSQCRGCSDELYVYASRTSHVIIDVIGYFAQNTATALQTYQGVSAYVSCPNNANCTALGPVCPSGYTLTGGGPQWQLFTSAANNVYNAPWPGNRWGCQFRNSSGSTQLVRCYSVCARIPGR
jgi:hypothetical protein